MQLFINQQQKQVKSTVLSQLLNELEVPLQGIAIAVNQSIVARAMWDETLLKENDQITIIKATRGG